MFMCLLWRFQSGEMDYERSPVQQSARVAVYPRITATYSGDAVALPSSQAAIATKKSGQTMELGLV